MENIQSSEAEENNNLQTEELEALEAIYANDFTLECDSPPTFSIYIRDGDKENKDCVLTISFPVSYPKSEPPLYQLSIPWLRGHEKQNIRVSLEELYANHIGENVVYLFVEHLREILLEKEPPVDPDVLSADVDISVQCDKLEKISCGSEFKPEIKTSEEDCQFPTKPTVEIMTGDPFTDRKSTFQAHVAPVTELYQIKFVLSELCKNKKIATATHNMYAYRICKELKEGSHNFLQDCEDDGETHAGSRLLHLLQILDCKNVMVVVTRWYGGVLLHGDRFKHINNVARQLLSLHGYINSENKDSKKIELKYRNGFDS